MADNYASTKQQLHLLCAASIEQRIHESQQAISSARQASEEDTKSSAGDKYETGRAMMQQEIDRHSRQLAEAMKLKALLGALKPDAAPLPAAGAGSLIITSGGNFYLAVGAGTLQVNGVHYHVVSTASPIGLKLKGIIPGKTLDFNGESCQVQGVY